MRHRHDKYEDIAFGAVEEWGHWILTSDYASSSVQDPAKWMGTNGPPQLDAMIGKAAMLRYSGKVKLTHEWLVLAESDYRRLVVFTFYLAPEHPMLHVQKTLGISKRRFDDIMREVYRGLGCYMRMHARINDLQFPD